MLDVVGSTPLHPVAAPAHCSVAAPVDLSSVRLAVGLRTAENPAVSGRSGKYGGICSEDGRGG